MTQYVFFKFFLYNLSSVICFKQNNFSALVTICALALVLLKNLCLFSVPVLNIDTICGKAEGISWWILSLGSSKDKNLRCCSPQGPKVFGLGTSRGTIFTRIPPRIFHILPFFCYLTLVTGILLQPILPLGSILMNIPPWHLQYWQC